MGQYRRLSMIPPLHRKMAVFQPVGKEAHHAGQAINTVYGLHNRFYFPEFHGIWYIAAGIVCDSQDGTQASPRPAPSREVDMPVNDIYENSDESLETSEDLNVMQQGGRRRYNGAARRSIEDYLERKRLRSQIDDDLLGAS